MWGWTVEDKVLILKKCIPIRLLFDHFAVGQSDAFSLFSSLSRPAAGIPTTAAPGGGASGKQLDLGNNAFGGLIGGIFNQALSNFGRPTQNGGATIDLGALANPQTWANFGGSNVPTFQPSQPTGGDVNFPGKVLTTIKATTTKKINSKPVTTTTKKPSNDVLITSMTSLADVPGWWWFLQQAGLSIVSSLLVC